MRVHEGLESDAGPEQIHSVDYQESLPKQALAISFDFSSERQPRACRG